MVKSKDILYKPVTNIPGFKWMASRGAVYGLGYTMDEAKADLEHEEERIKNNDEKDAHL